MQALLSSTQNPADRHLKLSQLVRTAVEVKRELEDMPTIARELCDCPFVDSLIDLHAWCRVYFSESVVRLLWDSTDMASATGAQPNDDKQPEPARKAQHLSQILFVQAGLDPDAARDGMTREERYAALLAAFVPRRTADGRRFVLQDGQGSEVDLEALRTRLRHAVQADEAAESLTQKLGDYMITGQEALRSIKAELPEGQGDAEIARAMADGPSKDSKVAATGKVARRIARGDIRRAVQTAIEVRRGALEIMPPGPTAQTTAADLDLATRWKLYDQGIEFTSHARALGAKCNFVPLGAMQPLEVLSAFRVISFPLSKDPTRWLCYDAIELELWMRAALSPAARGGAEGRPDQGKGQDAQPTLMELFERAKSNLRFPQSDQFVERTDVVRLSTWVEAVRVLQAMAMDPAQRAAVEQAAAHLIPSKVVDSESDWMRFLGRKLYNVVTSRYAFGARQAVYGLVAGANWFMSWVPRILTLSIFIAAVRVIVCLVTKFYVLTLITSGTTLPSFLATEVTFAMQHVVAQLGVDSARALWNHILNLPSEAAASPSVSTTLVMAVVAWAASRLGFGPLKAIENWQMWTVSKKLVSGRAAGLLGIVTLAVGAGAVGSGAVSAGALAHFAQGPGNDAGVDNSVFGVFSKGLVASWAEKFAQQMPLLHLFTLPADGDLLSKTEVVAHRVGVVSALVAKFVCGIFRRTGSPRFERACVSLFTTISKAGANVFLVASVSDVVYNLAVLGIYGLRGGVSLFRMPCLRALGSTVQAHDLSREVQPHEGTLHPPVAASSEPAQTVGDLPASEFLRGHEHRELRLRGMRGFDDYRQMAGGDLASREDVLRAREHALDQKVASKLEHRLGNPYLSNELLDTSPAGEAERKRLMQIYNRVKIANTEARVADAEATEVTAAEVETLARNTLHTKLQEFSPRSDLNFTSEVRTLASMAQSERDMLESEIRLKQQPSLWTRGVRMVNGSQGSTRDYIRDVLKVRDPDAARKIADASIVLADVSRAHEVARANLAQTQTALEHTTAHLNTLKDNYDRYTKLSDWEQFFARTWIKAHTLSWSDLLGNTSAESDTRSAI